MIKLSRKLEYALMSLRHIVSKSSQELTTAKEISISKSIPFDVTSRVLQIMAREGILDSIQGVQGGYKIVRDLSSLSLRHLVDIIEGPQGLVKCLNSSETPCEIQGSCNVHSPLKNINKKLLDFCETISVAEVIGLEHENKSSQGNYQAETLLS